jgi:hypothetical protein
MFAAFSAAIANRSCSSVVIGLALSYVHAAVEEDAKVNLAAEATGTIDTVSTDGTATPARSSFVMFTPQKNM